MDHMHIQDDDVWIGDNTDLEVALNPHEHVFQLLPGTCLHLQLLRLLCTLCFQLSQDVILAWELSCALAQ